MDGRERIPFDQEREARSRLGFSAPGRVGRRGRPWRAGHLPPGPRRRRRRRRRGLTCEHVLEAVLGRRHPRRRGRPAPQQVRRAPRPGRERVQLLGPVRRAAEAAGEAAGPGPALLGRAGCPPAQRWLRPPLHPGALAGGVRRRGAGRAELPGGGPHVARGGERVRLAAAGAGRRAAGQRGARGSAGPWRPVLRGLRHRRGPLLLPPPRGASGSILERILLAFRISVPSLSHGGDLSGLGTQDGGG